MALMHNTSGDLEARSWLAKHRGASARWLVALRIAVVAGSLGGAMTLDAQTGAQGAITGSVVTDDAAPVPGAQTGIRARTVVPSPGAERTVRAPPT
jgi:hypothetical protein